MAEVALKEHLALLTTGIAQHSSTDGVSSMSERKRNRLQELERRHTSSKNGNSSSAASCSRPPTAAASGGCPSAPTSSKQSNNLGSMPAVEQLDLSKGNAEQSSTDVSERKRNRLQELERRHTSSKTSNSITGASSCSTAATATRESATCPTASQKQTNGDFQGPVYAKLDKVVLDSSIASYLQLSADENSKTAVDSIIRELVNENGKAIRDLDSVLGAKVQDRILLLDNPAGHGKAVERARKRAIKSLAKRSKRHLSKRQQKMMGSFNFPSCYHKFDIFLPMHEMWKTYAKKAINENSGQIPGPWLITLDLHGAYLAVVQAKINNQVGVEGIMIRETTNTFAIVTKADRIKVIQKSGSVFVFRMDNMMITWFGDKRRS